MSTLSSEDHDHDHAGLGWRTVLLLLWAIIEVSYGTARDALVLANGYHDLFDVAFAMVVMYGAASREMFPQWRHILRCNMGPLVIITMTVAAMGFAIYEVANPGHDADANAASVVLLAVSAALSYSLMLGGRRSQSSTWSSILTWHFGLDVGGSALGAVVATVDLFTAVEPLRDGAAVLVLGLACLIGLRIIRSAVPLIHYERDCEPAGPGH